MKSRHGRCVALSLRGGFGYVRVRVLLPFPFDGRFYDSRRPLLSFRRFLMQKSDEMKAKSRLDHRRAGHISHSLHRNSRMSTYISKKLGWRENRRPEVFLS